MINEYRFILYIIIVICTYLSYKNGKLFYENRINQNKINPKIFDISFKYLPFLNYKGTISLILDLILIITPSLLIHGPPPQT